MTILDLFRQSVSKYPDHIALEIDSRSWTYGELDNESDKFALALKSLRNFKESRFIALLSSRSFETYVGVLGILKSGKAFIPVNPKYPDQRIARMLEVAECRIAILDDGFFKRIERIVSGLANCRIAVLAYSHLTRQWFNHSQLDFFDLRELHCNSSESAVRNIDQNDYAYLLFTSGSTGIPKGIPVRHKSIYVYISLMLKKYNINPTDRCSQYFDTSFDPSIHDLFLAWSKGACLVCVPESQMLSPIRFIKQNNITVWNSVPSMVEINARLHTLKDNFLPQLKYTLFTGEALYFDSFQKWKRVAPNSIIINGYGPTELTINISDYVIPDELSLDDCKNGIVPIGKIFPDHVARLIDSANSSLCEIGKGELCVRGPQMVGEYWRNKEADDLYYVVLNNDGQKWYKTGDLVEIDQNGIIHYLGRKDHQVQIRGFRVELSEVEATLRGLCGVIQAVVFSWPFEGKMVVGLVAALHCNGEISYKEILQKCSESLPDYMVPRELFFLDGFPVNVNGKIDRQAIKEHIRKEKSDA